MAIDEIGKIECEAEQRNRRREDSVIAQEEFNSMMAEIYDNSYYGYI